MSAVFRRNPEYLEREEREGGRCPACGLRAALLTCWACCESAWVLECGHHGLPAQMVRGHADGSDRHRIFCAECANEEPS